MNSFLISWHTEIGIKNYVNQEDKEIKPPSSNYVLTPVKLTPQTTLLSTHPVPQDTTAHHPISHHT